MRSELWQRLRAVRKYADLRQSDIAAACGISRAAVSQWEANEASKRTKPSINEVQTLAKLTGIPVEWILNDAANPEDVWQVGRMSRPSAPPGGKGSALPVAQEDRLAKSFLQAIEFHLLQKKPELIAGLGRQVGMNHNAIAPSFWLGDLLVEILAQPGNLTEAVGNLLIVERATGTTLRKAVLVLGGAADNILGIDVVPVSSPEEAAEYLVKSS